MWREKVCNGVVFKIKGESGMSVTFCESKRKTVFAVVVSAWYAVSVLLNFFMDVIRWNVPLIFHWSTALNSLLQLAAPVCVLVYLLLSKRECFFKKLLLPVGFSAFLLFNVNYVITRIPAISLFVIFNLYVLVLIFVLYYLSFLVAGVLCVLGCVMKNKRSLLRIGAFLYSVIHSIDRIGLFAVYMFTDHIGNNVVHDFMVGYNYGFGLLPFFFSILFYFSIFLLTTEKKAKNLNKLLH